MNRHSLIVNVLDSVTCLKSMNLGRDVINLIQEYDNEYKLQFNRSLALIPTIMMYRARLHPCLRIMDGMGTVFYTHEKKEYKVSLELRHYKEYSIAESRVKNIPYNFRSLPMRHSSMDGEKHTFRVYKIQ